MVIATFALFLTYGRSKICKKITKLQLSIVIIFLSVGFKVTNEMVSIGFKVYLKIR